MTYKWEAIAQDLTEERDRLLKENGEFLGLLREALDWKNSEVVQDSFNCAAGLTLTHPHLGVPVSMEFSINAGDMWERIARAALKSEKQ
jgi:hypothetical protein